MMSRKRLCAVACSTKASVSTAARPQRSARSGARSIICPDLTERQYSPAARPRLSSPLLSERLSTRKLWMTFSIRARSASCFITTSLPSRQARHARSAESDAARSVTEIWLTALSNACSPTTSPIHAVSFPTFSNQTALRQWLLSAAVHSRCLTPV